MSNIDNKQSVEQFISIMSGSKEVGLMVAKDGTELASFARMMEESGTKRLDSVFDFHNTDHGWYIMVDEGKDSLKEIYDFVCQYPLTVVSIIEPVSSKSVSFNPDYKHPIILLATDQVVMNFQKLDFDLMGRVGLVYRQ